ncbi:class I adenylate-forming enzyme family protein [Aquabacterium sp.]|uniref:class I adenylate-forming enzyme family protein n=1 Tax=Aquabacterium sp. TaxID=1872578 RepID=UPI002B737791|nr:AMP-binding protein [Aquabacterium sp.]HSW07715.1 AMP-binding protein [Aquabacterium sp.]
MSERPLYQRFHAQVQRRPKALAVQAGATHISYATLDSLVEANRRALQAQGHGPGHLIGWLGENSVEMLAALLACARIGAVFAPLNWRLALPELVAIAHDAGLHAVLASSDKAEQAAALRSLCRLRSTPDDSLDADDLLLACTSGTSGEPKGALHTQTAMLANAEAAIAAQGLHEDERVLSVLPLFHVGGLCIQTLPALLCGAALNLPPRFEAGQWLSTVAHWRPSTSLLVPAVMRALVTHPGWATADLSSLRFVNSGSSIVPTELIQAFHARGVPVAQVYGCTESGPVSIVLRPDEALAHVGQAGRPALGVQLRLVDGQGAEVPAGAVGEIWLQAPQMMRGYHHQPPLQDWFATGDLARCDAVGFFTIVGRSKDMIISGGENIYPAEIEQLAAAWPGVAEAAVVGLPDARWGEVPVLALVAHPGETVDTGALAAHFATQLARYKQPRRIVLLDALPKTALGKVQKPVLQATLGEAAGDR